MPVRNLEVLFDVVDRGSKILDPILAKLEKLEGKKVTAEASVEADTSGAEALEGALASLDGAGKKVSQSLDNASGSAEKQGKAAETSGKKTKESGDAAKYSANFFGQFHKALDTTASKFDKLGDKLSPIKGKLLALQATFVGLGIAGIYASAKNQSLVEELVSLKGNAAQPLIDWASQGTGKAYTSKSQRLAMAADLSDLDYSTDETKKYGEEIEKYFFTKASMMKRFGVSSAEELARTLASAEKSGNLESVKRLFSSGAVSEEKLNREMDRLRTNYQKFAFATDEVVKKQALHNLTMKELEKTNESFTGKATTLEQKLGVLYNRFSSLVSGAGDKLRPAVEMVVDGLSDLLSIVESIPGHDEILIFLGVLVSLLAGVLTTAVALAPVIAALAGAAGVVAGVPLLPIIAAIAIIAAGLYLLLTRTTQLKELAGKAQASLQKTFFTSSGGLKDGKTLLLDLGTWIRNFLDGLIPGWLSDIFAKGQSVYREAMKWFDKIMAWWNDFLKKVTSVYDKIKDMLGLGSGSVNSNMTVDQLLKSMNADKRGTFAGLSDNQKRAIALEALGKNPMEGPNGEVKAESELTEEEKASNQWKNYVLKDHGLGNNLLEIAKQIAQAQPIPTPEPVVTPEQVNTVSTPGGAETKKAYADEISDVSNKIKNGQANQIGPFDMWGAMLGGLGRDAWNRIQGGAEGATVNQAGLMNVHGHEEVIPARITQGVGKLGSLLGIAMDYMNSRNPAGQLSPEGVFSQGGKGDITVNLTIPGISVNNYITKDVDLRNLDIAKMIDWTKITYQIEKAVKTAFRTQQG
ncbi:MAG: hypothetical protein ACE14P_06205 [Methanotrichaceae archaeon]